MCMLTAVDRERRAGPASTQRLVISDPGPSSVYRSSVGSQISRSEHVGNAFWATSLSRQQDPDRYINQCQDQTPKSSSSSRREKGPQCQSETMHRKLY